MGSGVADPERDSEDTAIFELPQFVYDSDGNLDLFADRDAIPPDGMGAVPQWARTLCECGYYTDNPEDAERECMFCCNAVPALLVRDATL